MKWKVVLVYVNLLVKISCSSHTLVNSAEKLMQRSMHGHGTLTRYVVGGVDVPIDMFPYMVSVTVDGGLRCGGSIISDRVVLTSAHCTLYEDELAPPNLVYIYAGSSQGWKSKSYYNVCKILVHPKYDMQIHNEKRTYDIALLLTQKQIKFSSQIQKGKITETDAFRNFRDTITAIGFGQTENGMKSGKLKMTQLRYVSPDECEKSHALQWDPMPVTDHNFCLIGVRWTGNCYADSGSPVVWNKLLVGVATTTRSFFCGSTVLPSMYVDLYYFRPWILKNVKKLESFPESQC